MKRKPQKLTASDYLDYNGACILAGRIVVYWSGRGHTVNAEPYEMLPGAWGVRSDLVMGLPRTFR